MKQTVHTPDYDLQAAYEHNSSDFPFDLLDISNVLANIPGHNDEDHWSWIVELKNGDFYFISAWCDYTGWDCQSGAECVKASTATAAAKKAGALKDQLLKQLDGTQPYGLEIRS